MAVAGDDAWNFAYVLPSLENSHELDKIEVVVPNILQISWCESPPLFRTGSETARDVMMLLCNKKLPQHRYENNMLKNIVNDTSLPDPSKTTMIIETYINDFITTTNNGNRTNLQQLLCAMLHGIHKISPPPEVTGHNGHNLIAYRKLVEGDGIWSTKKEILGWEIDGKDYTIQLPTKKCVDICALIKKCLKTPKVPIKLFHKLAGKLQHAFLALLSGISLFAPLDMAMKDIPKWLRIDKSLQQSLIDWRFLVQCLARNSTHLFQLTTKPPTTYISYTNVCKLGTRWVWCSGKNTLKPFL